jgi:hypothetical protein
MSTFSIYLTGKKREKAGISMNNEEFLLKLPEPTPIVIYNTKNFGRF